MARRAATDNIPMQHATNLENMQRRIAEMHAGPRHFPLPPPKGTIHSTQRNGAAARLCFWEHNNPYLVDRPTSASPQRLRRVVDVHHAQAPLKIDLRDRGSLAARRQRPATARPAPAPAPAPRPAGPSGREHRPRTSYGAIRGGAIDWARVLATPEAGGLGGMDGPAMSRGSQLVLHFKWVMLEEIVSKKVFDQHALREMFDQIVATPPDEVRKELLLAVTELRQQLDVD